MIEDKNSLSERIAEREVSNTQSCKHKNGAAFNAISGDEFQTIEDALRALASGSANRSKIGRLRELLSEIEASQRAGVSNRKIVETLNAHGFEVTLKSFETMLYRLRKERSKNHGVLVSPAIKAVAVTPDGAGPVQMTEPVDDLAGLDSKQRREKIADQFINAGESQLAKRFMKDKKT